MASKPQFTTAKQARAPCMCSRLFDTYSKLFSNAWLRVMDVVGHHVHIGSTKAGARTKPKNYSCCLMLSIPDWQVAAQLQLSFGSTADAAPSKQKLYRSHPVQSCSASPLACCLYGYRERCCILGCSASVNCQGRSVPPWPKNQ